MSSATSGADVAKPSTSTSTTKPSNRKLRHSNPAFPTPFTPVLSNVEPFLSTLDKRRVYITHIDVHPGWFKRRVFLVPVLLNLSIALLLAWRLYLVLPWYISIARALFERPGAFGSTLRGVEGAGDWKITAWVILRRAFTFLLDYLLVTIVVPWPYTFFMEKPGNPMRWRAVVRFREQEICVRISRGWGSQELMGGARKGDESPFWKMRVAPAVTRENWLKTAYLLMGRDWDLDFAAMVDATDIVDKGRMEQEDDKKEEDPIRLRDLDRKVWVFYPPPAAMAQRGDAVETGQWLVATVGDPSEERAAIDASGLAYEGSEEGKKKIMEMRERLVAMGKEDLFAKWVQLVQEEVGKPGGFTKERQLEAGLKVQALFEQEGVDWENFSQEVGLDRTRAE